MFAWLLFLLALLALVVLIFWQYSNIKSIMLGAPAIGSPHTTLWRQLAKPDQTWLDLGCGNGSMCVRLAPHVKQVYGIEYSPFYYWVARWRTRRLRNVTIIYGDFFAENWPKSDVIYCYLLPVMLERLRDRLEKSPAILACLSFPVPDRKPDQVLTEAGYRLYIYR